MAWSDFAYDLYKKYKDDQKNNTPFVEGFGDGRKAYFIIAQLSI